MEPCRPVRDAIALLARLGVDSKRAGVGLSVYAAVLLATGLMLATSWVPCGIVVGAAVVGLVHAGAGLALVRRSAGRQVIVMTSGGLHVLLTIAWVVVLVAA